jgi:hypothetical protein
VHFFKVVLKWFSMNTTNYDSNTHTNLNTETDPVSDPILGGRARRGKIGRLSSELRYELNVRLDDGEETETILTWLNGEEEVQRLVNWKFGGSPINAQNLSNWRQGGFQRWLKVQERMEFMYEWLEGSDDLEVNESANELAGRLSKVLLAELAMAVQEALPQLTDPVERCEKLAKYLGILMRVRQQEFVAQRLVVENEQREKEEREAWVRKADAMQLQKRMLAIITGKKFEPVTAAELKAAGFPFDDEQLARYQAKIDALDTTTDQTGSGLNAASQPRRKRTPDKDEPIKVNQGQSSHQTDGTDGAEKDFGQDEQDGQDLNADAEGNNSIKVNQGSDGLAGFNAKTQ